MDGGHSIRIDIYAKDSKGKIYDIEVQRADEGADVHRVRFNSSMIDTRMLKESQGFRELHESYVIFITKNFVMGSGLPLYHIDRMVKETGIYSWGSFFKSNKKHRRSADFEKLRNR